MEKTGETFLDGRTMILKPNNICENQRKDLTIKYFFSWDLELYQTSNEIKKINYW